MIQDQGVLITNQISVFSLDLREEGSIKPTKREKYVGVHINAARKIKEGTSIFNNVVITFVGSRKIKIINKSRPADKVTIDHNIH